MRKLLCKQRQIHDKKYKPLNSPHFIGGCFLSIIGHPKYLGGATPSCAAALSIEGYSRQVSIPSCVLVITLVAHSNLPSTTLASTLRPTVYLINTPMGRPSFLLRIITDISRPLCDVLAVEVFLSPYLYIVSESALFIFIVILRLDVKRRTVSHVALIVQADKRHIRQTFGRVAL